MRKLAIILTTVTLAALTVLTTGAMMYNVVH